MACERCSAPCEGRYCEVCGDERMDEMSQYLTEKYDTEKTDDD